MSFSLWLYIYKVIQEKAQKKFEKKNKILSSKEIEDLLTESNRGRTIEIFKSAVVDHRPVDGYPYYLSTPIAPLFYHDNFKRCLIADALGSSAGALSDDEAKDAVLILDTLRGSPAECVRVFAWEALGRWLMFMPGLLDERRDDLLEASGGTTASLLGALLFLDHALLTHQKQKVPDLIDEGKRRVRYKVQKALFGYFVTQKKRAVGAAAERTFTDKDIQSFLKKCNRGDFKSQSNFEEGLKELGLLPKNQKDGLIPGTQQADICHRLKKFGGHYVSAIGFYLRIYWR